VRANGEGMCKREGGRRGERALHDFLAGDPKFEVTPELKMHQWIMGQMQACCGYGLDIHEYIHV